MADHQKGEATVLDIGGMDNKDDKDRAVEIDPDKVRITGGADGGRPLFRSVFGDIFDVFGETDGSDFPVDVFDRDFIEVDDVEVVEADEAPASGAGRDGGKKPSAFDKLRNKFRK